jgi:hypothetical protein
MVERSIHRLAVIAIALGRDKPEPLLLQGWHSDCPVRGGRDFPLRDGRIVAGIVKPACQDSSVGIDQKSVVENQRDLNERVAFLLEKYAPPILVEQFIFGREFHANIIEVPEESQV